MTVATNTEILALRARGMSVKDIIATTGAPRTKVRLAIARDKNLNRIRREPNQPELRRLLEAMRRDLAASRSMQEQQAAAIDKLTGFLGDLALDLHDALCDIEMLCGRPDPRRPEPQSITAAPLSPTRQVYQPRKWRTARIIRPEAKMSGPELTRTLLGDPPPGRSVADKLGEKA